MCGIVGFIRSKEDNHTPSYFRKFMENALWWDELRGDHGTGLIAVRRRDPSYAYWCKVNVGVSQFLQDKVYKEVWAGDKANRDYQFMVGHNRYATRGGKGVEACHPFSEGKVVMVHNGTVPYLKDLPLQAPYVSDSHLIAQNLAAHPIEDVTKNIEGAFALVWYNSDDKALYMVRNYERPLHLALAEDGNVYFMSDAAMLCHVLDGLDIKIKELTSLDTGTLVKFPHDDPIGGATATKIKVGETWYSSYNQTSYATRQLPTHRNPATYSNGGGHMGKGRRGKTKKPAIHRVYSNPAISSMIQTLHEHIAVSTFTDLYFLPLKRVSESAWQGELYRTPTAVNKMCDAICIDPDGDKLPNISLDNEYACWIVRARCSYKLNSTLVDAIVMCQFQSELTPSNRHEIANHDRPEEVNRILEEAATAAAEEEEAVPEMLPVGDTFVPRNEWFEKTEGGCVMCGGLLLSGDAHKIQWHNYGQDPVCEDCVKEYISSPSYGVH